jgi:hypothetical protein
MLAGLAGSNRRSVQVIPVSGGGPYGGGYRPGGYPYRGNPYGGNPYGGYRPVQPGYQPGFQPSFTGGGGQGIDIASLGNQQQPIQFWAHDETGVPGKTYRYRIRYSLFNPVHGAPQLVSKETPKLADTLYVTSPWSDWTQQVKVGDRVKFWLAGNPNPRGDTKFAVYTWQDGSWKNKQESVSPGDSVAGTSWLLVDVRPGAKGGSTAMLVNAVTGVTELRSYRRDAEDPDRQSLETDTATAAGAASAR